MRASARWLTLAGVTAIGVAAIVAALGSCVSDRTPTAPVTGTCSLPLGSDVPGSTVIVIRAFSFQPAEVRIRAGQKVTWVNCEDTPESHTSTSDANIWTSSLLSPGQAFTHTFDQTGTFPYHCVPHPSMTGRVIVE